MALNLVAMEAASVELHDWKQAAAKFVHLLRWEHEVLSGYEWHRRIALFMTIFYGGNGGRTAALKMSA